MAREALFRILGADFGSHPEARALNASFRQDVPILKLGLEVNWEPEASLASLAALEARLVKLCPSLRDHQCRGQEEYHILSSINGRGQQLKERRATIEPALALAHLYEHVMIDSIAFITDAPIVSGATGALEGSRKRFDIFVESPDALVAWLAVALATSWVSALVAGESLNGEQRTTLELIRCLYHARPDAVGMDKVAGHLGRPRSEVREGLDWLEHQGLARRASYTMNFSGLSYYGLQGLEQDLLRLGSESLPIDT